MNLAPVTSRPAIRGRRRPRPRRTCLVRAQSLLLRQLGRRPKPLSTRSGHGPQDGLGSTAALVDEAGSVVAAWDYSDYGETSQIAGESSVYNPFLYTGQEWDAELGMYHLRARHYAPKLGRFLARDPAGGSNLYAYCNGDPINYVDPTGLAALNVYVMGIPEVMAVEFQARLSTLVGSAHSVSLVMNQSIESSKRGWQSGCTFNAQFTGVSSARHGGGSVVFGETDNAGGNVLGNSNIYRGSFVEWISDPSYAGYSIAHGIQGVSLATVRSWLIMNTMFHELVHQLTNLTDPQFAERGVSGSILDGTHPVSAYTGWGPIPSWATALVRGNLAQGKYDTIR